jgi:hypothetical protein
MVLTIFQLLVYAKYSIRQHGSLCTKEEEFEEEG